MSITESYGLGGAVLEIDIQSLETSRCAKTKFEYEFYQDSSLVSDATDFITITDSPTTRSAKLSFYSTDPAKEGTWEIIIKEVDDGNKIDDVLSTDEHTITIDLEVTQCTPDWQPPSDADFLGTYEYKIGTSPELVIDFVTTNGNCLWESSLIEYPGSTATNRWGNIPSSETLES